MSYENGCHSCEHQARQAIDEPCAGCRFVGGESQYSEWQPIQIKLAPAEEPFIGQAAVVASASAYKRPPMLLPTDAAERKGIPITEGVLDYFPLAIAAVANCSKKGNDQHNPGQPLHWARDKSTDHANCIARHLIDRFAMDTDGVRHATKLAWRALALLQTILEEEQAK
jgi:hypothetical protein